MYTVTENGIRFVRIHQVKGAACSTWLAYVGDSQSPIARVRRGSDGDRVYWRAIEVETDHYITAARKRSDLAAKLAARHRGEPFTAGLGR